MITVFLYLQFSVDCYDLYIYHSKSMRDHSNIFEKQISSNNRPTTMIFYRYIKVNDQVFIHFKVINKQRRFLK